ncbi:MAG: hypothetical protein WDO18_07905 [Acidobacteriota bacterium]
MGLDAGKEPGYFADYSQWAAAQLERKRAQPKAAGKTEGATATSQKKKLSYMENREFEAMEETIAQAELVVEAKRTELEEAAAKDPMSLQRLYREVEEAQQKVDDLYARWAELGAKIG